MSTEGANPKYGNLDLLSPGDLVSAFVDDQRGAAEAVYAARASLAAAVEAATPRIEAGGRLIYAGAGTSARLGLLDSTELYPTFSWPHERSIALVAGGSSAIHQAVEGAEDDKEQGGRDLAATKPTKNDVIIALAASGTTPYVLGVLAEAKKAGALTIGIANNDDAPVTAQADIGITLSTGAEVISGSTRLKAGTAQKIALNTLSSAIMVRLGKVFGTLMVDMLPTNAKLVRRTISMTVRATGCDEAKAKSVLEQCGHSVSVAIVAIKRDIDVDAARALLAKTNGRVRAALET
jgi:N-acetylmuramic acid 6-phosphate etherase